MIATLDHVLAEACKRRFFRFFCEFWETIESVELRLNWHIEFVCDVCQEAYERWERGEDAEDVLINIPPGTSKSTIVSQLFNAWCWLRTPGMRFLSSSYSSDLAVSHAIKTRDCLKSDKFRRLFPGRIEFKADVDGKTNYRNTSGGQRFVTSTNGSAIGVHADCIVIDDPLNVKKAASDVERKSAVSHVQQGLSTRKTDKRRSFSIMVMQRLHELDPAGEWIAKKKRLRHICLPGRLSKDIKPVEASTRYVSGLLDPVRLDEHALQTLLADMGSYGFAGQVQQTPSPEEGGLLKKAWFKKLTWPEFLKLPGAVGAVWNFDADTAYTNDQKNDPSAVMASAYLGQNLYVRHVSEHWLELPELKRKLLEIVKPENGYTTMSRFYVEPKATGKSVVQELRSISQLNVVEAPTPKDDKPTRVNAVAPFIEAGRVILIDGSWNDAFISQAATFPTGAHDDMLDCLTQAIARYNKPKTSGFAWS
ncbi:phage terminase large subunit [Hymenobacter sp. YC55]|uniref:phage terminase large subunit n=1 Tax=Hymenobacter sp. YC55 TaxID=3034019 RepID=UPI0023F724F5|nr:phage terminase large subunit [Hymenobacter sp. YC55]MDF7810769.1 phage terminase large subunit [Hymenobacter sp. YC55]